MQNSTVPAHRSFDPPRRHLVPISLSLPPSVSRSPLPPSSIRIMALIVMTLRTIPQRFSTATRKLERVHSFILCENSGKNRNQPGAKEGDTPEAAVCVRGGRIDRKGCRNQRLFRLRVNYSSGFGVVNLSVPPVASWAIVL